MLATEAIATQKYCNYCPGMDGVTPNVTESLSFKPQARQTGSFENHWPQLQNAPIFDATGCTLKE